VINRLLTELRRVVARTGIREVHYSFATFEMSDAGHALGSLSNHGGLPDRPLDDLFAARFAESVGVTAAVPFGQGRMAFYAILKAMGIGHGDEVILPGFTCVVVPAAIVHSGAAPVYADIQPETFNVDPDAVERAVTPRTRAIVAQHTFGRPAPMRELKSIASRHRLALIEDCAHLMGHQTDQGAIGSIGDAAFFSLELTKPLNIGQGGVAVTSDPDLRRRLQSEWESAFVPGRADSVRWAGQLALSWALYHPNAYWIGRLPLAGLYRTGLFASSSSPDERQGARPRNYPARLGRVQARVGLGQLPRLHADNATRVRHSVRYREALRRAGWPVPQLADVPYLRFPLLVEDRARATALFRKSQVELGHWFNAPLHPEGSPAARFGYQPGSCPRAEWASRHIVNLPTHPGLTPSDEAAIDHSFDEMLRQEMLSLGPPVAPQYQRA